MHRTEQEVIVAVLTGEQVEELATPYISKFTDGKIEISDVVETVPLFMEIMGKMDEMSGSEKQESVHLLLDYFLEKTDTSFWGIPDVVIDSGIKMVAKLFIPIIYKATRGDYAIPTKPAQAA